MRIATRTERGGARATLVALVAVVLLALGIMVAPQQALAQDSEESVAMYRLYNPYSGEHFYTSSESERDTCVAVGWSYEGVGWYAPATSSSPVYRLYNPYSGDHHYTMSASERDMLVALGWRAGIPPMPGRCRCIGSSTPMRPSVLTTTPRARTRMTTLPP